MSVAPVLTAAGDAKKAIEYRVEALETLKNFYGDIILL
jgi:hypothetical protein